MGPLSRPKKKTKEKRPSVARKALAEKLPAKMEPDVLVVAEPKKWLPQSRPNDALDVEEISLKTVDDGKLLRPHSDEEQKALTQSIASMGQLSPIIVDNQGAILDGRGIAAAVKQLGIEPWVQVKADLKNTDKAVYRLAKNAHYRDTSLKDRLNQAIAILQARPELSDGKIAGMCAVHRHTVANWRTTLERNGYIAFEGMRMGKDGVKRPATITCSTEEPKEDEDGNILPGSKMDLPKLQESRSKIRQWRDEARHTDDPSRLKQLCGLLAREAERSIFTINKPTKEVDIIQMRTVNDLRATVDRQQAEINQLRLELANGNAAKKKKVG